MNYLVFDIGGTNTRFAFFRNGKMTGMVKVKTVNSCGLKDLLVGICESMLKKYNLKKFDGIGVSAPGCLNCEKLELIYSPNLSNVKDFDFGFLKKFSKKVVLEKDANCAALGALKLYNVNNLVCLTLGTGLGCGIIIDGKLYKGRGEASEFAHTIADMNGVKCSCGNRGCIENYVSARGLMRIAKRKGLKVDCIGLSDLAKKGNRKALKIFEEYGKFLSIALANAANTLDPELIVLTGGLTNSAKFFISEAKRQVKKKYYRGINPKIVAAKKNLNLVGGRGLLGN